MNNLKYVLRTLNIFGYNSGNGVEGLNNEFKKIYGEHDYFVYKNGRHAIYSFLKALNLPQGSEVLVQAFTCNAVITPILALGLVPKYVDIDANTFNMSFDDLHNKFGNAKALILQHTFGIKADSRIIPFCRVKGIYVIEDCAHTLGDPSLGFEGDAAMFSFGIEKLLPTRVGGVLVVNNPNFIQKVKADYLTIPKMSTFETFQLLVNPIVWRVLRVAPFLKPIFKGTGLLIGGFTKDELEGNVSSFIPKALSSVLAREISMCLSPLEATIQKRNAIVNVYASNLDQKYTNSIIRYPYIAKSVDQKNLINESLEKHGVPTRDVWFSPVVFPNGTSLEKMGYVMGTCKVAEDVSSRIVNLPTSDWVSEELALKICADIKRL